MSSPGAGKADRIQQQLTQYASALSYAALPAEVIHQAKVRVIDTLGDEPRSPSPPPVGEQDLRPGIGRCPVDGVPRLLRAHEEEAARWTRS